NQGQGWITIPIGINVDATGRVLTITPNSLLAVNSQYYLYLTNGITDATAAHNSINTYGEYFNTVFSANTTAPTVVAFNPPANATNIGTNVPIQLEFSTDMNQGTDTGVTVTTGGNPVAGTFMWNSNPYGTNPPGWGPGTVLYFTPTAPLAANTTYTVSWGAPLADTAGNAVTPGSFTFTTGSGSDTATNNTSSDIVSGLTNVGTNVAPQVWFSKPVNPININTSTLQLYNSDSGKYINGTVTVAPNGLSATFTPSVPLLPDTYYRLYMASGYYDADGSVMYGNGAYLNGMNTYFTTGNGSDLVAPSVASVSPANSAIAVPLNAQVIVKFTSPVDPDAVSNIITVTPSGGSAIAGTVTLASDLVTLFFAPTNVLAPATVYTVQLSGYQDVIGNVGSAFSSTFTTITSIAPLNVSTGLDASGNLITTSNTADAHWSYVATAGTSGESNFKYPGDAASDAYTGALKVVASGAADWYGNWDANGPSSSWIAINPNSTSGNSYGFYSTSFNLTGPLPAHVCLVGAMSHDDNGLLAVNGQAIMGDQGYTGGSLVPLNIEITSYVSTGTNYLIFAFGNTDNNLEGLRLQGVVETCGASLTSATSVMGQTANLVVTGATPSYSAGGVATNSTITLTFNNPLDPTTVNSTTLPVMIGWNSNAEIAGNYVVTGNQVVFTPDSPFPASTQIWVGACNGPYDLAGDSAAYNSCYTQLTYFNTASTATPVSVPFQVMAFTPANGAANVGLRAPVTATFNRSLNFGSINSNDYALFNGDGQSPWCSGGSYSHSQDGTSISFNCGVLPSSATLTAMLGSGLQDWNGDGLTPYTSQFTTTYYDYNTHGSETSVRPTNGASGVNANLPIVLYFNLPLNVSGASSGIEVAQNNVAMPGTVNLLDNGYTLEFTPSSPWTPGALIQWWTTGSLTDTYYNATVNTTSGYFYVAASTSTLTPAVQVAAPSTYSSNVPLNSIFDVQFNTPLNPATVNASNVYIFDNSNGNVHIPVTMTQPQPNEILMVPTSALPANHYLYVYIGTGLQSTTSVPASQTQWWEYTGTTSDSTTPVVTSAVPYNGASGVGVNVTPGVVISKTIDPVSVNSNTFQVTNGGTPLAGGFWFNSSDTRVEFVPNAPLPANTSLVMTFNGVLDLVGNPINFSSSFQTGPGPDFTAPTVVWTSVTSNESIPVNSSITIQFSESMDVTTFSTGNSGDIYIYDSLLGVRVPATLSWNSIQSVAYLAPSSPLAAGREYYFYVNTGTDLAGNQVSGIEITFYAEFSSASSAPTVINFNPSTGATGLGTNAIIEAQFSGPIDPNTLGGVTLSTGGSTVTTSPNLGNGNTVLQL
ncbi:MAG: Ig-like domain-containing protein, partial [Terracidiphilus sp.]